MAGFAEYESEGLVDPAETMSSPASCCCPFSDEKRIWCNSSFSTLSRKKVVLEHSSLGRFIIIRRCSNTRYLFLNWTVMDLNQIYTE